MFTLGVVVGFLAASIAWYIEIHSLKTTIANLQSLSDKAKQVIDDAKKGST